MKEKIKIVFLFLTSILFGSVYYNGINYIEKDMPIIIDGNATQHIVTAGNIDYINSWSLKELNINGQNYSNSYITHIPTKINGMYFIEYIPRNKFGHFEMVGITNWDDTLNIEEPKTDTTTITMPFNFNGIGTHWFCIEGTPTEVNSWGLDSLLINNIEYKNMYNTIFPERIDNKYYIYYKSTNSWSHFEIDGSNEIYSNKIDTIYINESYVYEGVGKKMFIPNFFINNINSWLTDSVSINNVDITNKYMAVFPDTIDGKYYIYYESSNVNSGIVIGLTDQALPVELSDYGWVIEDGKIIIQWTTQTETESGGFFVNRNGEFVYGLDGAGTTTEPHSYAYVDENPLDGMNAYEIFEIDLANNSTLLFSLFINYNISEQINILDNNNFKLLNIYPNPTNSNVNIEIFGKKEENINVSLYDISGKLIKRYDMFYMAKGLNVLRMPLGVTESSIYIVDINNIERKKIIVLK